MTYCLRILWHLFPSAWLDSARRIPYCSWSILRGGCSSAYSEGTLRRGKRGNGSDYKRGDAHRKWRWEHGGEEWGYTPITPPRAVRPGWSSPLLRGHGGTCAPLLVSPKPRKVITALLSLTESISIDIWGTICFLSAYQQSLRKEDRHPYEIYNLYQ
jgi:hypothetical protein